MVDALLISMPFGAVFSPSIALSLLQPQLRRRNLTCEILYFTLPYAELIGQNLYCGLTTGQSSPTLAFIGEWIFSDDLFDRPPDAERAYINDILMARTEWWAHALTDARTAAILRAKRRVPEFLDVCVARVIEAAPRILGFTSVFQQHVASLALARRVKTSRPDTLIVFGGANVEGVMGAETLRQYPFVDAVVSGEGDLVFPELASRVIDGASWADLPGVLSQQTVRRAFAFGHFPNTPVVTDLDALPYPDYSDYFAQFNKTRYAREWQPGIFIETSRGCWWGERMHCTFCGLNGSTMTFRSKSAERAFAEFKDLAGAYPGANIQVVDNILDLKYFNTLLPELAKKQLNIHLFYETKSNLKKAQVRLLGSAGVRTIQPGIESLSDQVLKLMKKGVSGLQNIQLLKWCKQFGVEPLWNLLFGFPGELPEEYDRMAHLVPYVMHLPGPKGFGNIRIDRFSPNFFDSGKFGFANVRPMPAYRFIHDVSNEALQNLAYHFEYDYQHPTDVDGYVRTLVPQLTAWRAGWRKYELLAIDDDGVLILVDTRPLARAALTVLKGLDRDIYLACDAVAEPEMVMRAIASNGSSVTRDEIVRRLASMVDRGIVLADGQKYLALAVPVGDYQPAGAAAARVLAILSLLGRQRDGRLRVPLDRLEYQLASPPSRRRRPSAVVVHARERRSRIARLVRTDFRIVGRRELRVRRGRSAG